MRAITRCPNCQTQFFVSEDQLNKHNGKVRCGQCMHVFDAKMQFITSNTSAKDNVETAITYTPVEIPSTPSITSTATTTNTELCLDSESQITVSNNAAPMQATDTNTHEWPLINDTLDEDEQKNLAAFNQSSSDQQPNFSDTDTPAHYNEDNYIVDDDDFEGIDKQPNAEITSSLNGITKLTLRADNQTNYFDDLANNNNAVATSIKQKSRRWPWLIGAFILFLIAMLQSIYFLRDEIVIYYPNVKPYLIKACQQLNCNVNLPKQINLIVIDDSDMQEDINISALMHFSCSLFNQAPFTQAYPNLELTLTDVEDKPTLRRVFKPNEYLPINTNVALGFKAGEEIKIKLGITTQGVAVAGYRVFVSY